MAQSVPEHQSPRTNIAAIGVGCPNVGASREDEPLAVRSKTSAHRRIPGFAWPNRRVVAPTTSRHESG